MKRILPLFLLLALLLSACGGVSPAGEDPTLPPEELSAPGGEGPEEDELPILTDGDSPDEDELPILTDDGLAVPSASPAPAEEKAPALSGTELTLDGLSSYLRVTLPEGWTWAQAGGAVEGTVYGLWPEADPDFKVELHFWPEKFAMCGTGVTVQDYVLPGGQKAALATEENGETLFWTLILPEAPDSFTIQFSGDKALYEAHRAELELLLGTIRQGVRADLNVVTPETSAD